MRRALLIASALAVLTACSTPTTGTPAPATNTPPTTAAPTRPRELRLDGIDPCSLLTPAQVQRLGLREGIMTRSTVGPPAPGPSCTFSGTVPRAISVSISLATTTGIDALNAPGALSDQRTPTVITQYPAWVSRPRNPDSCFLDVDVASGQLLDLEFADGGRLPPIPQDQLCKDVVDLAGQVLQTLGGH